MTLRRELLRCGGVVSVAALAGCVSLKEPATDTPPTDDQSTDIAADVTLQARLRVGNDEQLLFRTEDIESVGRVSATERTGPTVPLELTDGGTASVVETAAAVDLGERADQAMIVLTLDDSRVNSYDVSPSLGESMATGEWGGRFVVAFEATSAAEAFREQLVEPPA